MHATIELPTTLSYTTARFNASFFTAAYLFMMADSIDLSRAQPAANHKRAALGEWKQ